MVWVGCVGVLFLVGQKRVELLKCEIWRVGCVFVVAWLVEGGDFGEAFFDGWEHDF